MFVKVRARDKTEALVNVAAYDKVVIMPFPLPPHPPRFTALVAHRDRGYKEDEQVFLLADVDMADTDAGEGMAYLKACLAAIEAAFIQGQQYCDLTRIPEPTGWSENTDGKDY